MKNDLSKCKVDQSILAFKLKSRKVWLTGYLKNLNSPLTGNNNTIYWNYIVFGYDDKLYTNFEISNFIVYEY
jgi:hypothetical protein